MDQALSKWQPTVLSLMRFIIGLLLLQYGNMSKQVTQHNTRLFAEKVRPRVKDLFSEWEDRWWPKPMDRGQRAAVPAFQPRLAAE